MNCTLLATVVSLLVGGTLVSERLLHTSFEKHTYTVGQPLDGQDGWTALVGVNAAKIARGHHVASSGRQAIRCFGADLEHLPSQFLYDGAWEKVVPFDPITTPSEVRVKADVRLDGPDTGNGPADDLVSANLYARNGSGRSAFMFLSSTGNAYAFANSDQGSAGYRFETPIQLGEYVELAITLNYATHVATFEVDGHEIGQLPFGGVGEQWRGALLEMGAYDDPLYVDHTLYTAYWDDLSVQARPVGCRH